MAYRRSIANSSAVCALACAALALAGCAHKRRRIVRTPAPPQIINGETGLASWYGHPYDGRAAADGSIYHMEDFTAAHRTLPFGTRVRVVNLTNNKTVDVRITDRGPFVDRRIIDVSHAAAKAIGLIGPGVAPVRLDILSVPNLSPMQNWFGVQAGAFRDQRRAKRLCATLQREYGTAQLVLRPGRPPMWRVLAGRLPSENAAAEIAQRIRKEVGDAFVVRLDSPVSNPTAAAASAATDTVR